MSSVGPGEGALAPAGDDDLMATLEGLDAENEHYLGITALLRDLLEDAVTRQVALEREAEQLRAQLGRVEGELVALHNTKLMRFCRPLRSLYGRWRRRRA